MSTIAPMILAIEGTAQPVGRHGGGIGDGYAATQTPAMTSIAGRFAGGVGSGYATSQAQWTLTSGLMRYGGGIGAGYASSTFQVTNLPLPVEFGDFEAYIADQSIQLMWSTLSEKDNDYFLVQRSGDGVAFKNLGMVSGNGTINQPLDYSFRDSRPLNGANYYRLKQVDFDGKYEYLEKVFVWFDQRFIEILFPNPVVSGSELTIQHEESDHLDLQLFDIQGRRMNNLHIQSRGNHYLSIEVAVPPGHYVLQVSSAVGQWSEKIIVK